MKRKPFIDDDGEMRPLTAADFAEFRPAREVLDPAFYAMLVEHQRQHVPPRGPGKKPRKVQVSIRLDAEVYQGLQAHANWRQTANQVLREWLGSHAAVEQPAE